jgi:hypothetical protein
MGRDIRDCVQQGLCGSGHDSKVWKTTVFKDSESETLPERIDFVRRSLGTPAFEIHQFVVCRSSRVPSISGHVGSDPQG